MANFAPKFLPLSAEKGFSLIEVMIAMAIFAIGASVAALVLVKSAQVTIQNVQITHLNQAKNNLATILATVGDAQDWNQTIFTAKGSQNVPSADAQTDALILNQVQSELLSAGKNAQISLAVKPAAGGNICPCLVTANMQWQQHSWTDTWLTRY